MFPYMDILTLFMYIHVNSNAENRYKRVYKRSPGHKWDMNSNAGDMNTGIIDVPSVTYSCPQRYYSCPRDTNTVFRTGTKTQS